MKAITHLVTAAAALITTASAIEVHCNAGFVLLNGNTCIKVFTEKKTWEEAKAACTAIDNFLVTTPHLAYIEDCSLMPSLHSYINYRLGLQEYLWLGGTDSSAEGNWQWLTGEPVPMGSPYWHAYQPDGDTLENKLVLSRYGYFADAHEADLYGYICQYAP